MPIPRSAAVIAPDGSLDSSALQRATDQLTSALARAGVESGTTVALMLPNSVAFVPTYLALRSLSATVALIPPKYGPAELEAIRQGAGPACFVTTATGARAIDGGRVVPLAVTIGAEPLVVSFCGERGAPMDAAVLKFTSGSTGQPKGIALTAAALEGEAANIVGGLSLGPGDHVLAPVPLSHSYGFDLGVLAMLRSGCTLALEDTFVPRRLLAELASGRVTVFLGVPAMYRGWLEDGFLYIDGRIDDLINVGGFKVSPREVIDALESFPAVAEAAVVGVRDSRGEEVVYAVVALARPATEAEILAHCRTRLAEYKVPRRVEIRTTLPRGPTGKVQLRADDVRV